MSHRLVAQHESPTNSRDQSFGYELFRDEAEDYYTTRFHIRTYDGIKVTDSWASDEVRLDATGLQAAHAEVLAKWRAWIKAMGVPA